MNDSQPDSDDNPAAASSGMFEIPDLQLRCDEDSLIYEAMTTVLLPLDLSEAVRAVKNMLSIDMIAAASPVVLYFLRRLLESKGYIFPKGYMEYFIRELLIHSLFPEDVSSPPITSPTRTPVRKLFTLQSPKPRKAPNESKSQCGH